jgi:hypothetical protein
VLDFEISEEKQNHKVDSLRRVDYRLICIYIYIFEYFRCYVGWVRSGRKWVPKKQEQENSETRHVTE